MSRSRGFDASSSAARGSRWARLSLLLALLPSAGAVEAHDWYTGLTSPAGEPCCSGRDCEPADHRYDRATGRLEVEIAGTWVPVDSRAVLSVPAPDGRAHVCWWRHWTISGSMTPEIRCVILPGDV